ncbi:hypothetical protein [Veillonella sp. R32]|uniref:hypothetical protein n=1 Tax=Veillonella sp. R32 TaxID=2021312 RepID=UPI0013895485|nr:hypothetical protein [Veillonella sp. R32]KAF1683395.1 hypothetical protein VER_02045 [Veillonella sp. R32]
MIAHHRNGGYLYAEALGGTLITVVFILTITALISSLVMQWRQAQLQQQLMQAAITAMEEGKYNYQHQGQLGALPEVQAPYKLVRTIHTVTAHDMAVKELEAIGYYEQQEMLHFKTYVWEGVPTEQGSI